mmetsp:Transcript_57337/g.123297  ORF Transcript_57337/g.123297 Transcript_57337/m.123297 type:complete len:202 (-) Transcript_57337:1275-1880(-)
MCVHREVHIVDRACQVRRASHDAVVRRENVVRLEEWIATCEALQEQLVRRVGAAGVRHRLIMVFGQTQAACGLLYLVVGLPRLVDLQVPLRWLHLHAGLRRLRHWQQWFVIAICSRIWLCHRREQPTAATAALASCCRSCRPCPLHDARRRSGGDGIDDGLRFRSGKPARRPWRRAHHPLAAHGQHESPGATECVRSARCH